jgi:CPA2 family monovalent cation:H+ antiporter-2
MEASHASFSSLVIVVVVAFLTPILLNRMRIHVIPVVVAEIIAGLIIGQTGFDLVEPDMLIETLSTLGFIYLLFLSGLEIDFSVFAGNKKKTLANGRKEPSSIVVALTIFMMILIFSYLLSLLFVWAGFISNVYLMTLVIGTISLGIVVPTLKDADIVKTSIGQTILLITVVGDLVTMILLAVFVSVFSENSGNTWLLLILFVAGVLLYFLGKYFKHQSFLDTLSKGTIQIDTRAVFTLIIVLVSLSQTLGAEAILGAFLAGALVSLLSPNPSMVQKLDSFGYGFLIPIFFVMIGVNLNLWNLFADREVLILMPLLFLAFLLAKIVPALWLAKWYGWKTAFSVGFLVAAKLTLVIAAAKVGERMELIDTNMSSAIILVAVISCIIGPIVFKNMFPKMKKEAKSKVAIIGANQLTLPMSLELDKQQYETAVYHVKQEKINGNNDSDFDVIELDNYKTDTLKEKGLFESDILVVATGEDKKNCEIACEAKENEMEHVIARIERHELRDGMREKGIKVFSSLLSAKSMLRVMIESPDVADIFTTQENGLFQVDMNNSEYNGVQLRDFPFLGDTIIVRIVRGNDPIIPHGDTEIKLDDHLIVTGGRDHVDELRETLS